MVNFKNTIIIMTSNIGSEEFNTEAQKIGFNVSPVEEEKILSDYSQSKEKVLKQLPDFFAPEFLNRIDKTIVFNPLDKKVLRSIVVLQLNNLSERMKEIGIEFTHDTKLISHVVSETYNPEYGARPVRRYIQDRIEDAIADAIVDNKSKKILFLTIEKKQLCFRWN